MNNATGPTSLNNSLIFDNLRDLTNLNDTDLCLHEFYINGLNLTNVSYPEMTNSSQIPQVDSLLRVMANKVSIENSTFKNVSLLTNKTENSPIILEIFNFSSIAEKEVIRLSKNTFNQTRYTFMNPYDVKISGVLSLYHDKEHYDLNIEDSMFDNITVEFLNLYNLSLPNTTIETGTILQNIFKVNQTNVTDQNVLIKNTGFDNVF